MSGEMYQKLDLHFRACEPDTRREVLELAKSLASHIAAKATTIHGRTEGILAAKDIAWYLRMEAEAEIHNTFVDSGIFS